MHVVSKILLKSSFVVALSATAFSVAEAQQPVEPDQPVPTQPADPAPTPPAEPAPTVPAEPADTVPAQPAEPSEDAPADPTAAATEAHLRQDARAVARPVPMG